MILVSMLMHVFDVAFTAGLPCTTTSTADSKKKNESIPRVTQDTHRTHTRDTRKQQYSSGVGNYLQK